MHEGLTLTRCDVCRARTWCAIQGAAICGRCCPAAVEGAHQEALDQIKAASLAAFEKQKAAQELARKAARTAQIAADAAWLDEYLPPSDDADCGDMIPASLIFKEFEYWAP